MRLDTWNSILDSGEDGSESKCVELLHCDDVLPQQSLETPSGSNPTIRQRVIDLSQYSSVVVLDL